MKLGSFTSKSCSDMARKYTKKRDARAKLLFAFLLFSLPPTSSLLEGDVTRDDSQRRFLAQHSVAMLERC